MPDFIIVYFQLTNTAGEKPNLNICFEKITIQEKEGKNYLTSFSYVGAVNQKLLKIWAKET